MSGNRQNRPATQQSNPYSQPRNRSDIHDVLLLLIVAALVTIIYHSSPPKITTGLTGELASILFLHFDDRSILRRQKLCRRRPERPEDQLAQSSKSHGPCTLRTFVIVPLMYPKQALSQPNPRKVSRLLRTSTHPIGVENLRRRSQMDHTLFHRLMTRWYHLYGD